MASHHIILYLTLGTNVLWYFITFHTRRRCNISQINWNHRCSSINTALICMVGYIFHGIFHLACSCIWCHMMQHWPKEHVVAALAQGTCGCSIGPRNMWLQSWISNFETDIKDKHLEHFLYSYMLCYDPYITVQMTNKQYLKWSQNISYIP